MKLIDLKLKGFIGIQKGLGLEEVHLPLGDLSGLVALDGPNGRGKTTILENLQPFRQFASRKGGLKKHCFAKDSQKELIFTYRGDVIRTLIKMDAHTTRSDEGFLWINDKPMVDGKVTSYDAAIKEIFGSPNLFFWSIFCAQNSKRLIDLNTGKLKELFTEFLRLERYTAFEDTTKMALGMLQGVTAAAESALTRAENDLLVYEGIRPDEIIENYTEAVTRNTALKTDIDGQIAILQKGLEDAKTELALNEEKSKQLKVLTLDLGAAKEALTAIESEKDRKTAGIGEDMARVQIDLDKIKARLLDSDRIRAAHDRCLTIDNRVKTLGGELEIAYKARESMQTDREEANRAVVALMQLVDDNKNSEMIRQAQAKAEELSTRFKGVEANTIDQDPDFIKMQANHAALVKQSLALDQKDADCISEKCGLIVDAIQAQKDAAELLDNIAQYTVRWENGKQESLDEILKVSREAEEHLAALTLKAEEKISEASAKLDDAKAKVKFIDEDLEGMGQSIGVKLSQKKTLEAEFDTLSADAKQLNDLDMAALTVANHEKHIDDLKTNLAGLNTEYESKFKAHNELIETLTGRVDKIQINHGAAEEFATMETGLKGARESRERYVSHIDQAEKKITEITQMKQRIEDHKAVKAEAIKQKLKVTAEVSEWSYLKTACGKKGLQALEIDAVSPTIEAYANDLLISTFGPGNTIRFETQDPDGKEVLNIVVMDPDGSETLLENKSGGEAVWILKALRLALTLLSKEKSGRDFETVLMDEEDGALSPANAVKFIGLYRSMMDIGGFDDCFYISHKQEAVGLANHRLIFGDNGIQID